MNQIDIEEAYFYMAWGLGEYTGSGTWVIGRNEWGWPFLSVWLREEL